MPGRLLTLARLGPLRRYARARRRKVVFTNGAFDLLHAGHVRYLTAARALGDLLVVGLNSDASVRRLKGRGRPILSQADRAVLLLALRCVDYVVIFPDDTPHRLVRMLQPQILVKGADWPMSRIVGRKMVQATGGRVVRIRFVKGRSTTSIIKRIASLRSLRSRRSRRRRR